MSVYLMLLQYDGTRYNGWQRQGNTSNTIQEKLENLLSRIFSEPVEIAGSGRTDAGVHAEGQTASFHISAGKNRYSCGELCDLCNRYLPEDIRVLSVSQVPDRFHARLLARSKVYEYRIDNGRAANVFTRRYRHHISDPLDADAMQNAAAALIGTMDFKSFCDNRHMKKSTVRTITSVDIIREGSDLTIRFQGNGFLYHMVRLISQILIEIGLHQRPVSDMERILQGQDRSLASYPAPPQGLFLVRVYYDDPSGLR